jgi:hypothetical protein
MPMPIGARTPNRIPATSASWLLSRITPSGTSAPPASVSDHCAPFFGASCAPGSPAAVPTVPATSVTASRSWRNFTGAIG